MGEWEPEFNERVDEQYLIMEELERLESLREEMEELGVTTLVEIEDRIAELHALLDELERRK